MSRVYTLYILWLLYYIVYYTAKLYKKIQFTPIEKLAATPFAPQRLSFIWYINLVKRYAAVPFIYARVYKASLSNGVVWEGVCCRCVIRGIRVGCVCACGDVDNTRPQIWHVPIARFDTLLISLIDSYFEREISFAVTKLAKSAYLWIEFDDELLFHSGRKCSLRLFEHT